MKTISLLILSISLSIVLYSQPMSSKMIKSKDVKELILKGEITLDSELSKKKNSTVYKFRDGRLLFVREDGKGILWNSLSTLENEFKRSREINDVTNFKGWISSESDLETIEAETIHVLSNICNRPISFDLRSLDYVNRINTKDINSNVKVFRAIIYFSCVFQASQTEGYVSIEKYHAKSNFRPVVIDKSGTVIVPYAEFLRALADGQFMSIKTSISLSTPHL